MMVSVSWAPTVNGSRPYELQGHLARAAEMVERAASIREQRQIPALQHPIANELAYVYALSGRVDDAVHWAPRGRIPRFGGVACGAFAQLGEVYQLLGRSAEAADIAQQALAFYRERGERGGEAWALRLLSEIAAHADPPEGEQAESCYRQALALADELGMRPLAAHCHLGLGTLYQKVGRHEQARAELATATEMYRAMDMAFWLARAEAVRAHIGTAGE